MDYETRVTAMVVAPKSERYKTVYYVGKDGQVTSSDYKSLVERYAKTAPTNRGIERVDRIEEVTLYALDHAHGYEEYRNESDAIRAANEIEEDTGVRPTITPVTRWDRLNWLVNGWRVLETFGDQKEAEEALMLCAIFDFENDPDSPIVFDTRAEAEQQAQEIAAK